MSRLSPPTEDFIVLCIKIGLFGVKLFVAYKVVCWVF